MPSLEASRSCIKASSVNSNWRTLLQDGEGRQAGPKAYRTHHGTQRAHLLAHGHSREGDLLLLGDTIQGQFGKKIL